jgi:hypothetical protein
MGAAVKSAVEVIDVAGVNVAVGLDNRVDDGLGFGVDSGVNDWLELGVDV